MKKVFFTFIVMVCSHSAFSQHGRLYTDKIIAGIYRAELMPETINRRPVHRFLTGVSYAFSFTRSFEMFAGFGFNFLPITDYCKECADAFYGVGQYNEYEGQFGVGFNVNRHAKSPVYPFSLVYVFYSATSYRGEFDGGISGQGYDFSNQLTKMGGFVKIGVAWDLPERGYVSASAGLGGGVLNQKGTTVKSGNYLSYVPFEVRTGIYFGKSHFRKKGCTSM
ncbi:MAG: hypothetical protein GX437_12680 [Sphingobacteriales bacterium]|nr:hypothetical protein [Sphingobacteriales bacterium]